MFVKLNVVFVFAMVLGGAASSTTELTGDNAVDFGIGNTLYNDAVEWIYKGATAIKARQRAAGQVTRSTSLFDYYDYPYTKPASLADPRVIVDMIESGSVDVVKQAVGMVVSEAAVRADGAVREKAMRALEKFEAAMLKLILRAGNKQKSLQRHCAMARMFPQSSLSKEVLSSGQCG
jgi:hypothetical protein